MTNEERWSNFIAEFKKYIEEHHLGPSRHTDLYNKTRYYRKRLNDGSLDAEKAKDLEEVLGMRDFWISEMREFGNEVSL